jgi:hypothetical protein
MSTCRTTLRRAGASIVLLCVIGAIAATTATARPPSHYRNWAQTPHNAAGVVFHPYGDFFEVWGNRRGPEPYAVLVEYNYKDVNDRWKPVFQQILVGPEHFKLRQTLREHRHIFFRIFGPDGHSAISEYRTT